MCPEGQLIDDKSLRSITGPSPDWAELAKDCVCFANAQGGILRIGIEDGEEHPPAGQEVTEELLNTVRRRIGELTVNVSVTVERVVDSGNGGAYLEVTVLRARGPASTLDGRFYLRVSDSCKPLVGEDIQRLLDERSAQPWETLSSLGIPKTQYDPVKLADLASRIRASDRVKDSVKEKSNDELIDHYFLAIGGQLTNLGVLCIGNREDRARLGSAPSVQFIKYDADGKKVHKITWDDYSLTPIELVEAVWREVPDFREYYELPEGLLRQQIPVFDGRVIRELLVNALVHRPYTQRGDIYLNLYQDRLQAVNPGPLPLGVTPRNILHQSIRRNNELARIFHDIGYMEREGSGFDLMYEVLTSQGRSLPEVREGADRVEVTIPRRVLRPEIIDFLSKAEAELQLNQRERIALGILVQHEALSARELCSVLDLPDAEALTNWLSRLVRWKVVRQTGKTSGTRYFVDPHVLRRHAFPTQTTLARIEPYRTKELILEDARRHPGSSFGEIHARIGKEIPEGQVRRLLKMLSLKGEMRHQGDRRWRKYWTD